MPRREITIKEPEIDAASSRPSAKAATVWTVALLVLTRRRAGEMHLDRLSDSSILSRRRRLRRPLRAFVEVDPQVVERAVGRVTRDAQTLAERLDERADAACIGFPCGCANLREPCLHERVPDLLACRNSLRTERVPDNCPRHKAEYDVLALCLADHFREGTPSAGDGAQNGLESAKVGAAFGNVTSSSRYRDRWNGTTPLSPSFNSRRTCPRGRGLPGRRPHGALR